MLNAHKRRPLRAVELPHRDSVLRAVLALGAVIALAFAATLPVRGGAPAQRVAWGMIGRDVNNTRSQTLETRISPANAARLAPKWVVTTTGDVSATPAVGVSGRDRPDAVYFPDWGGRFWKVDAETGAVLWVRSISEYNRIPGSLSRTSPVLARGMVYVADLNGNMMAVDTDSGGLRWITELDPHPAAIVTTSPVVLGDRLYIGISSNESRQPPACCSFRGSVLAVAADTGRIVWQSFVLPDNGGRPGGFAGGAFVNPPAIDLEKGLVYAGAGQLYTQPNAAIGHNTRQPYILLSGQVVSGGSWAALDPSTGRILWQTADPQGEPDLAALTVANGVLYGGSMAHTGNQMYALDAATGAILWRFPAGGSVVSGPAVVGGAVFWGSGYARTGGVGNNKFYAFSIDGR